MSLPRAGVELVAANAPAFFSDLAKGEAAQDKFGASSKTAATAVNSFGSATSANASKVDELTQRLGFQQRQYGILQKELDQTKVKYGENSDQAVKQQLALDKLGAEAVKTAKDIDTFSKENETAGKSSSKFGEIVTGAMRQVGAAITNVLLDAGRKVLSFFTTDAVSAGAKFEATMSGVSAALGPTAQEMDALTDIALRLGKETAFSAQEAGEAIEALGLNGLSITQILGGAADATVYLAAATGTDLTNAANIATDTMADFGITAEQMGEAINGIAGVTVASKFGIDDYRLALAQAGGVAGAVGVSFDDFNTTIAATSARFASGSDAGTSFKTFLTSLVGNSDAAISKMRDLGIVTEDGSNQFFDAAGNMKDMDEIAGVLQAALKDLTEQEKNQALKLIFGNDAMRTAIGLAEKGTDGFHQVADAIAKVDANQQGVERMNNFSGSLEEAKGSAETLQITIATKVLPFLTKLIRTGITPAINSLTEMAENSDGVVSAITAFASNIKENGIPALTALGVAAFTYAVAQLPIVIAANSAAIASFIATAAATAVAMAPYALLALAVFAIAKAYQGLQEKIDAATQSLLAGKAFWTESQSALDAYGEASEATQAKTKGLADALEYERKVLEDQVRALGERMVNGKITQAQYEAEMLALNQQADAIEATTGKLNGLIQADVDAAAAALTSTNQQAIQAEGMTSQVVPAIKLTTEELTKLAKEYDEVMQKGGEALSNLTTTHSSFLNSWAVSQAEHEVKMSALQAEAAAATTVDEQKNINARIKAEQEGWKQSLEQMFRAYAEQASAQRAALGEQLLAYTENQRQLGNISAEKAAEIREVTIREFGVQRDSAAAMFGEMTSAIDQYASGAIADSANVAKAFRGTEAAAVELKQKADALKDKYVMELVAEAAEAGADIDAIKRKLADIPRRVESEIHVTTSYSERRDNRGDDPSQQSPGRAFGGSVQAGKAYTVGETRPEVFVPNQSGRIIPSLDEFERKYNPPSQNQSAGGSNTYNNQTTKSFSWVIQNPQPEAVDSLTAMVRLQQVLNYG